MAIPADRTRTARRGEARRPRRGGPLGRAELARLRAACGPDVDPERSLCPPGSIGWRVNREAATLLGGGRALLMQVAHPLVAAGVAAHSRYREEPLERLRRTLELSLTVAFADAAQALRAVQVIEGIHARVRGTLAADVGPFPRGTPFAASDPALLFWVHATLVDSALVAYERFVAPLTPRERAAYYAQSQRIARLFGIPESFIPPTWRAFTAYVRAMIAGETLTVGDDARAIAATILRPPVVLGVQHALRATNLATVGLLPPPLRARFGLGWSRIEDALLGALGAGSRVLVPWLPAVLRFYPQARHAPAPS